MFFVRQVVKKCLEFEIHFNYIPGLEEVPFVRISACFLCIL